MTLFPSADDRLAYWLNAYAARVRSIDYDKRLNRQSVHRSLAPPGQH